MKFKKIACRVCVRSTRDENPAGSQRGSISLYSLLQEEEGMLPTLSFIMGEGDFTRVPTTTLLGRDLHSWGFTQEKHACGSPFLIWTHFASVFFFFFTFFIHFINNMLYDS